MDCYNTDKFGNLYKSCILNYQPSTLVLSGGALRGLYLIGVLDGLRSTKFKPKFDVYIGSSSGAILCFLLSLGFEPFSIFNNLLKDTNIFQLSTKNGGLYSTTHIFDIIKNMMDIKKIDHDITFEGFKKNLYVIGFNLTSSQEVIFSKDTHPDMSILKALEISSCLPIIFGSIRDKGNDYIDGGCFNNFAIEFSMLINDKLQGSGVLGISTVQTCGCLKKINYENINIIMVDDRDLSNLPIMVLNKEEKFLLFEKGKEHGEKFKYQAYIKRRLSL